MRTRASCEALDAADATAPLRSLFDLPSSVVYLDGNSLGPLPTATPARVRDVVANEWGRGLVRSWNSAGWIDLARRVGDKIARLVGAGPGEVVVADSTSVNVYKALSVACDLALDPGRNTIVSEAGNFPTDLYIADSVARQRGFVLRLVDANALRAALDETVAAVVLTHVDYRSGRLHDMAGLDRAAHAAGALTVWDLSHSAGALPIDVRRDGADFAVGCGYKYLNGGPGAPAYLWAHPARVARMDDRSVSQPLPGWLGHADPFAFSAGYQPAPGSARFACGTPPILSLAALECGVDTALAAEQYGGLTALQRKAGALGEVFMQLVESRCAGLALTPRSPRDASLRGCQVSYACAGDGYAVMQALAARGVVGDFRAPDLLRFGLAPMYTRFADVWDAVEALRDVLATQSWRAHSVGVRPTVT